MAAALDTSQRTVFRTKRRYAEVGVGGRAARPIPKPTGYRKLKRIGRRSPPRIGSTGQALIALSVQRRARRP